jgi:DNA-binding NarL/FixJ family response regulator
MEGIKIKQIAVRLCCEPANVYKVIDKLKTKFHAKNRTELVINALFSGVNRHVASAKSS